MSLTMRHLQGRKGQALAEFALILPVLFLLIAGIIEFGRAWNIKQAVTDAAREGARFTVVVDTTSEAGIKHRIKQRLSLANIDSLDPPTQITITPIASLDCVNGAAGSGAEMSVNVQTKYRMGWVGAIMQWTGGTNTITISSKATMRNEC
jgi:Flp pilus assembly protein TadG